MKKLFSSFLLILAALYALVPMRALAAAESRMRSVNLDASVLRPENGTWDLGGSEVCFGQYGGEPVIYRALCTPETQTLSEDSLFLDCRTVLRRKAFDNNFKRNEGQEKLPSEWKGSDLELWLNGSSFYESRGVFTQTEQAAIAETTLADARTPYSTSHWVNMYRDFGSTDHVFLISAAEVSDLYAQDAARAKDGATTDWWVRSAFDMGGNGAGSVHFDGHVCNNSVSNFVVGVSPALNVKLHSIVLVTAADGDKTHPLDKVQPQSDITEWKLTLLDPGKTITFTDNIKRTKQDGNVWIYVPCTWDGNGISQISLVLTDASGQPIYYGATEKANGHLYFILPPELCPKTCGRDYFAYLLAEDVNGPYRTDYASQLYKITVPNT